MRWLDTANVRSAFVQPYRADDGTMLSADIYRPPEPGSYPVLVTRTPYDNNRMNWPPPGKLVAAPSPTDRFKVLAASGCIVVATDVRGRGDSDGAFVPFANEVSDGAATVQWAAGLDECNGQIVTFGSGYEGFCAIAAAVADPSSVAGVSVISPFGPDGLPDRGGVVRLDWLFWQLLCGGRTVQAVDVVPWMEVFDHVPLRTMDTALGRSDLPWQRWLDGDGLDEVRGVFRRATELQIPVVATSGWWDPDLRNAVDYAAATRARLIVGPWDARAARWPDRHVGRMDWGHSSVIDPDAELIEFVTTLGQPQQGARVFVTGRNDWQDVPSWPPPGTTSMQLRLGSAGAANSRTGDGVLTEKPAATVARDTCTADPDQPVPLAPTFTSFSSNAPLGITLNESHISSRDDALCYMTEPFDGPVQLAGRPTVMLWVETDAPDGDIVVTLSDVFPYHGRSINLSHTAVRLATVDGFAPGQRTRVDLELHDVCHEVQPGHAIRLTVTTGLFPLYARNLHQDDYLDATEARVANLTVVHDDAAQSAVTLPVIESQAVTAS